MKNILIPMDFSEEAVNSLKIAESIYEKNNAKITILHVLEIPNYFVENNSYNISNSVLNDLQEDMVLKAKNALKSLLQETKIDEENISFIQEIGSPKQSIINHAKKLKIDLIIMGTKGISNLEDAFIGSNAENIVRLSDCPVISTRTKLSEIKNITLASNFKTKEFSNYQKVIELALLFDAKIHLVHINTPNEFINSKTINKNMELFVKHWKLTNYSTTQYNHEKFEAGLFLFCQEKRTNLIAIGTHDRNGLSRLFYESKNEQIVNHFNTPILSFKI